MRPLARIGDKVVFSCGTYPIVSGSFKFLEGGKPVACLGDKTACPGSIIVSGAAKRLEKGKPVARVGDRVTCPQCGVGVIMSGSMKYLED